MTDESESKSYEMKPLMKIKQDDNMDSGYVNSNNLTWECVGCLYERNDALRDICEVCSQSRGNRMNSNNNYNAKEKTDSKSCKFTESIKLSCTYENDSGNSNICVVDEELRSSNDINDSGNSNICVVDEELISTSVIIKPIENIDTNENKELLTPNNPVILKTGQICKVDINNESWVCQHCTTQNEYNQFNCGICLQNKEALNSDLNSKQINQSEPKTHEIKKVNEIPEDKWICGGCTCQNGYDKLACINCETVAPFFDKWRCETCTCINEKLDIMCKACGNINDNIIDCRRCHNNKYNKSFDDICEHCLNAIGVEDELKSGAIGLKRENRNADVQYKLYDEQRIETKSSGNLPQYNFPICSYIKPISKLNYQDPFSMNPINKKVDKCKIGHSDHDRSSDRCRIRSPVYNNMVNQQRNMSSVMRNKYDASINNSNSMNNRYRNMCETDDKLVTPIPFVRKKSDFIKPNYVNDKNSHNTINKISEISKLPYMNRSFQINHDEDVNVTAVDKWNCRRCHYPNEYDIVVCVNCEEVAPFFGKWRCDTCTCINEKLEIACKACDSKNVNIIDCSRCHGNKSINYLMFFVKIVHVIALKKIN